MFIGLIYIVLTRVFGKSLAVKIIALVLGLVVCYAFGTVWFMYVYTRNTGDVGIMAVLSWCVFPFILPDLLKMALAFVIAKRVEPAIK